MSNDCSVYANFSNAYPLAKAADIIRQYSHEVTLTFTSSGITLNRTTVDNTVLIILTIDASSLKSYTLNAFKDNNGKQERADAIMVNVEMKELVAATKNIRKNYEATIYMKAGDPCLYIQAKPPGEDGGNCNVNIVSAKTPDQVPEYTPPSYSRGSNDPNALVEAKEFVVACNNIKEMKCSNSDFAVTETGIRVLSYKAGAVHPTNVCIFDRQKMVKEAATRKKGTKSTPSESKTPSQPIPALSINDGARQGKTRLIVKSADDYKVSIENASIKPLAKLGSVSEKAPIKLFLEDGKPLKIVSNISNYGYLSLFFRNVSS